MKAQLGRPTGIALVLLATLLVTILAIGVYGCGSSPTSPSADQELALGTYGGTWGKNVDGHYHDSLITNDP